MSPPTGIEAFGQKLGQLYQEIQWELLEPVYCDGDAEGFFDEERRDAICDAGLKLTSDIGEVLKEGGKSLYVGAAVAELVPMLFERIVMSRRVAWVTLPGPEADELTRAIKAVDKTLPTPRTGEWRGSDLRPRDHIWMTSVLTDPEAFPALHDQLYRRQGTKEAVGGGHPKAERRAARELVENVLAAAAQDTVLTTTDEELDVWRAVVQDGGHSLKVATTGRTSAIVGDIVRVSRLRVKR